MKHRIFQTHSYSLKRRFFTSIAVFIIIPLIVTAIIITIVMFSNELTANSQSYIQNMEWASHQTDNLLLEAENIRLSLYLDHQSQKYLKDPENSINNKRAIQALMKEQTQNKNWYKSICVTTINDITVQWIDGTTLSQDNPNEIEQTYKSSKHGHWTNPRYLENLLNTRTGFTDKVLTYYGRIYDYDDIHNILGIISVSIDASYVSQIYTESLMDTAIVHCLLNPDGTIFSSSDSNMDGTILPHSDKILPLIKNTSNYSFMMYQSTPCIVFFHPSTAYEWTLVSIIPIYHLISNYLHMLLTILFTTALCIIFAIVFWIQQKKIIIKPIEELSTVMLDLSKSELNYSFSLERNDEIGILYTHFEQMETELKNMIQKNYISEIYRKDAQMQMLVSQINPHFLYNTLDAIRWFAIQNQNTIIAEKILQLSNIFRHILSEGHKFVTLRSEIDILGQYINIINFQNTHQIEFIIDIPEEYLEYHIPVLILQPLVENSILHGLKNQDGCIAITAEILASQFYIHISDDGIGMDQEIINQILTPNETQTRNAFAIKNVMKRIQFTYGDAYTLQFRSNPGEGTTAIINLPIEEISNNETTDYR